jgi:hypothetical protein
MIVEKVVRRLRGAARIAVAWGVTWFALAFVVIVALRAIGFVVPARVTVPDAIGMSIKVGVMGGLTGGAFSLFISQFYRGRRLSEISWARFGIGGGIVAGLFVPGFLQLASLLTGGGLVPFDAIRGDMITATAFGGIAAAASMWLAQRAEEPAGERERPLERLEGGDPLAAMEANDVLQRERTATRDRA